MSGAVSFTFNEDVFIDAADLEITNISVPGTNINFTGLASGFSYNSSTFTATWDLAALAVPLPSAFYDLQLVSESIAAVDSGLVLDGDSNGSAGDRFSETLYVAIPGDADLDGIVSPIDRAIVQANIGVANPTWAQGDFDGDGQVEVTDVNIFSAVNSGDLAVTLAALHTDLRPPVQIPVIAAAVTQIPETVEVDSVSLPAEPTATTELPVELIELAETGVENDVAPVTQQRDQTVEAADTTDQQDSQRRRRKFVGVFPVESANDVVESDAVPVEQDDAETFDAAGTAVNQDIRRKFIQRINALRLKLRQRLSDVDGLSGSIRQSRVSSETGSSETERAKAIEYGRASVVDRLFSHDVELFDDWS